MESRRNDPHRPYLLQSGEVDKFLRKLRIPSPYRRPLAYKYPNDSNTTELSSSTGKYSTAPSGGYANGNKLDADDYYHRARGSDQPTTPRYNSSTLERKPSIGSSPLYNSSVLTTRNSNYNSGNVAARPMNDYYHPRNQATTTVDQHNDAGRRHRLEPSAGERIIPIQIKDDQNNNNLDYSNFSKREYSAEPAIKRFSSSQNILGHPRSGSSTIFSSTGFPRRQSVTKLWPSSNAISYSKLGEDEPNNREDQREVETDGPKSESGPAPPPFDNLMDRFRKLSTSNNINDNEQLLPYSRSSTASSYVQNGDKSVPTKTAPPPSLPTPMAALPPRSGSIHQRRISFINSRDYSDINAPNDGLSISEYRNGTTIKEQQQICSTPCLKGLANHGNTCYFSAVIQCLANCAEFAKHMVCNGPNEFDKSSAHFLASSLASILRALWFNHPSADCYCHKLLTTQKKFVLSQQQDSHECLIWLLDSLGHINDQNSNGTLSELQNGNGMSNNYMISHRPRKSAEEQLADATMDRVIGPNRSSITDLFHAQFRSAIACSDSSCDFTNLTFDPYLTISLSVPLPKRPYENYEGMPLVQLIEDYVKRETVQDWKCPKCGNSPGFKQLKFHSLPNVLIFHLKRFELLDNGAECKIESRVQMPLEGLDMSPYVFNPSDVRASTLPKHNPQYITEYLKEDGSMVYDLIGIVNHFGQRTTSGHYTATCKNPVDGQWRTFDDSRVLSPSSDIRTSTSAYLLFYAKRKNLHEKPEWFPRAVPEEIVAKYGGGGGGGQIQNGYGPPIQRMNSYRFDNNNNTDYNNNMSRSVLDVPPPPIPARSSSLQPTSDRHRTPIRQYTPSSNTVYSPSSTGFYSIYPRGSLSRSRLDYYQPRHYSSSSAYRF